MMIMKRMILLLTVTFVSIAMSAQEGYHITIKIPEFKDTTAILAYHLGNSKYIKDTLHFDSEGVIEMKGDKAIDRGMYLLVVPGEKYFEFIIADDQDFTLETHAPDFVENMKVSGSLDNELFYRDMKHIISKREAYEKASARYLKIKEEKPDSAAILKETMENLDSDVRSFRAEIKKKYPQTFYAKFLKALDEPDIPEIPVDPETGEADSSYPYRYYKSHYFDGFDFSDPGLLRTPVFHQKLVTFMKDLTPQLPDSVIASAEYILKKVEGDSILYQYTLAWMLNRYAKREIMGMDKVYVYLAEEYYMKGKAPWISKDQLKKIVHDALALKPLLIGNKAPDFVGQDPEGKIISMYSIDAPYLIVAFWDADCGHCRKEIPKLYKGWKEKLKDKGVKVLAVSLELTDNHWRKFIAEKSLSDEAWINTIDLDGLDDYRSKYDIKATPTIYILDKDKKIIGKWLGADQIPDFIMNYDKRQKEEKEEKE